MRVLLAAPSEVSSGEAITALHIAEQLAAAGDRICFLASHFAGGFIKMQFPHACRMLGADARRNRRIWDATVRDYQPDVIVFADYPLWFFTSGVAPLSDKQAWARSLDDLDACLVTLDHLGFAQRAAGLFFGPPHLSFHYESWPAVPDRMYVLLPCPMHEPAPIRGRKGIPIRYWDVPLQHDPARRRAIRQCFGVQNDEYLVFHSVAHWASRLAKIYELPYYRYLPEILEYYLGDLPSPVTVVSVNGGSLLHEETSNRLRIINIPSLPKTEYEALLFGANLVLTENGMSYTLGKAICGLQACAVLRNSYRLRELLEVLQGPLRDIVLTMESQRPGAVFPYDVFPSGLKDELKDLGLFLNNSILHAFRQLEVFGGAPTRNALQGLLTDPGARDELTAMQSAYVDRLARLDTAAGALHRLAGICEPTR